MLLLTSHVSQAEDLKNGENHFNINCLACHQIDSFTVGPSLVEISEKYPTDKREYFIGWANQPGKVSQQTMQMPAMAHVGDKNLTDIHAYILEIAKGKTEKKKQKNAPSEFSQPAPVYPFVSRLFMPKTSPATITIGFREDFTLAWDTSIANIRYAVFGAKAYMEAFKLPKKMNLSGIKYSPNNAHPFSFADVQSYQYIGYKLKNNLPEILYQYGDVKVSEKLRPGKNTASFIRHFHITGLNQPMTMDLSHSGNVAITSTKGQIKNNLLTINALDAQDFVIEVTIK
jgi:cytochrome c551/c552